MRFRGKPFLMAAGMAIVAAQAAAQNNDAAVSAGAQGDAAIADPVSSTPDEAEHAGPRLDEIVVTAQKRAQGLQDVPLSLSVVSAEEIAQKGIQSFTDMARFMPNVSINEGSNSMYIRGIGTPELNPIGEQAIAYIIDGVYVPKIAFVQAGFMDIERVEVLKGPQGTLFGRNATAGVFNITNGTPSYDDWRVSGSATFGDRDMRGVEAMLTGPIIEDVLAFRIAGKKSFEEGSTVSISDGGTLGDREHTMLRGSIRASLFEDLEISVGATYFDFFFGQVIWDELYNYPTELALAFGTIDPNFETKLDRRTNSAKSEGTEDENRNVGEGYLVPIGIEFKLWDHTITSVTGFSGVDTFFGGDIDLQKAKIVGLTFATEDRSISEELRIQSAPGKFEYVLGFYYLDNESHTDATVPAYGDFNILSGFPLGTELGVIISDLFGADSQIVDNLLGDYNIETQSIAVFGEATWHITDDLNVTLGARQTWDDKTGAVALTNSGPLPVWPLLTDAPYAVSETILDVAFTPKATIAWAATEGINLYATYAQGFRAGGFNAGATQEVNVSFDAEYSTTYEVGLKSLLWDSRIRLNASAYYTDYEDYQFNVFTGLGYVADNAPEMELKGVEADVAFAATETLTLQATLGYNDARFTDHTDAPCRSAPLSEQILTGSPQNPVVPPRGCDLTGRTVPRAPKITGSVSFDYGFRGFRGTWPFEIFLGGDASYKGKEWFDADLDPVDTQDGHFLFNARVGARDADGRWSLEVHGKNLADKTVKLHSGDAVAQPGAHAASLNAPRYFFATGRVNF